MSFFFALKFCFLMVREYIPNFGHSQGILVPFATKKLGGNINFVDQV